MQVLTPIDLLDSTRPECPNLFSLLDFLSLSLHLINADYLADDQTAKNGHASE